MKPSRKFLFDNAFDFEEPDSGAAQARPAPTVTAVELEAAKQSAHADGIAAGLDQALRRIERHCSARKLPANGAMAWDSSAWVRQLPCCR